MSEFRDRLRQELDAGRTPEEAYDHAVAATRKELLVAHFRPIGVEEARHIRRQASRQVENRVFTREGRSMTREDQPGREVTLRDVLAKTVWYRGDGTSVSWLDATVDEHDQRAEEQRLRAAHHIADAERHERVAKMLRNLGRTRLGELSDDQIEEVAS